MPTCPRCGRRVSADPDKHMVLDNARLHRACAMQETGEYALIDQLFNMQDEPDEDPTTAMADLIGDIGHFAASHNKSKRGGKRIDFEDAVRRGLNYYQEEAL